MTTFPDGSGVRVLIVDDEFALGKVLVMAFNKRGYQAMTVKSGAAAEHILRSEHVDCLVVDLLMPDMQGDVLFHIAAAVQPHLRHCTIFTTGDISDAAYRRIAACECPKVDKPFDMSRLLTLVQEVTQEAREDASA